MMRHVIRLSLFIFRSIIHSERSGCYSTGHTGLNYLHMEFQYESSSLSLGHSFRSQYRS